MLLKFDNYYYPKNDNPVEKDEGPYVKYLVTELEKMGYKVLLEEEKPKTLKIMFVYPYEQKKLEIFVDAVSSLLNLMDLVAVSFLEDSEVPDEQAP